MKTKQNITVSLIILTGVLLHRVTYGSQEALAWGFIYYICPDMMT